MHKKVNYIRTLILTCCALIACSYSGISAIDITGVVTQFGTEMGFKKVHVKGPGFQQYTHTRKNGTFSITVTPTVNRGVIAIYTLNCVGDTHTVFKEFDTYTLTAHFDIKLCSLFKTIAVKGKISYKGVSVPNAKVCFALNNSKHLTDSIITDENGFFSKTITTLNNSSGLIYATIIDCDGKEIQKSQFYNEGDTSKLDFKYCEGGNFKILTGKVINDSIKMHMDDFRLLLYKYDPKTLQIEFIAQENSDFEGVYRFLLNREGDYLLKVIPKSNLLVKPTYFGGSSYWDGGQVIKFNGDTILSKNIPVFSIPERVGELSILGKVIDNRDKLDANHTVYLKNKVGKIIDFASCNDSGNFSFTQLKEGNYELYADVVGLPTNAPQVVLEAENLDQVYLLVNKKEVSYQSLSTLKNQYNYAQHLITFPNPFINSLNLSTGYNKTAVIKIIDITGKIMYEATLLPKFTSIISTTYWKKGFYIVSMYDNGNLISRKKLVK